MLEESYTLAAIQLSV